MHGQVFVMNTLVKEWFTPFQAIMNVKHSFYSSFSHKIITSITWHRKHDVLVNFTNQKHAKT